MLQNEPSVDTHNIKQIPFEHYDRIFEVFYLSSLWNFSWLNDAQNRTQAPKYRRHFTNSAHKFGQPWWRSCHAPTGPIGACVGNVQHYVKQPFALRYLLLRTKALFCPDLGDERPALLRLTLVASLVYQTAKMLEDEAEVVAVPLLLSVVVSPQTRRNNM